MEKILKEIINEAIWAPSAENCQPWSFKIFENKIHISNLPERDVITWGQRASYFAIGSLIENIKTICYDMGYYCEICLFPEQKGSDLVAILTINKSYTNIPEHSLYPFIKKRATNRKPFKKIPLTDQQINELSTLQTGSECKLIFQTNKKEIHELAEAVSVFEKIIFSNQKSHSFFFNHISWNEQEDQKKSIGFFIKTLELSAPAKILFPIIKHWSVMKILNKINFAESIRKENSKVYNSCSAMACIIIPSNNKEHFVTAGALMQKIWLTATKMGLYIQPLAGIVFSMLQILYGNGGSFSPEEKKIITDAYSKIQFNYGLKDNELIAINFRIGLAEPPTAKSSRFSVIMES